MSDVNTAEPAADTISPTDIIVHKVGGEGPISLRDAARSLNDSHNKFEAKIRKEAESAEPAAPAEELAPEANAAQPEEAATGETQADDPEETLSPLDLPRSWTKDRADHWAKLDRATQEFLHEHDRKASAEVRRVQNEAAEARKAAQAEQAAVAQARQQYEHALPALLQTMYQQQAGEFGDVKTHADLERLANEDPARYLRWDAQQKKIAAVAKEVDASSLRQQQELGQRWSEYAKSEDQKFAERVPDIADAEKAPKLREAAVNVLKEVGYSEDELGRLWNGQDSLSLRDHRLQLLILDGVKFREAKATAAKKVAKPVPPVQRPGVAPRKGEANDATIKDLETKISKARGLDQIRLAAQLQAARRG